jgi:hypothetical protein
MKLAGHSARREQMRHAYSVVLGKREGKNTYGRPRHKWEANIKIDLRECMGWIRMARDKVKLWAFVNTVTLFGLLGSRTFFE